MNPVVVKQLGLQPYQDTWQAMRDFTQLRTAEHADQLWFVEHPPVFTQGQAGKAEHVLAAGDIPIVQSDRGGQVTYHGPGQLIVYTLVDLRRKQITIRELVTALENSVIALLHDVGIEASNRCNAPGVYVDDAKICSLGLRVRRGCSYHGLALNVAMDLAPFKRINPCGFSQLEMTQLSEFIPEIGLNDVAPRLLTHLQDQLRYTRAPF